VTREERKGRELLRQCADGARRAMGVPIPLKERDIERTCTEMLMLDGWRELKTEAISERSFIARVIAKVRADKILGQYSVLLEAVMRSCARAAGVGELGMADHLYIRYACDEPWKRKTADIRDRVWRAHADVLFVEYKRPKGNATAHQRAWHAAERARGALTWIAGEDFKPATFEGFKAHYLASGLNRRIKP
jgi:hypothetical protein